MKRVFCSFFVILIAAFTVACEAEETQVEETTVATTEVTTTIPETTEEPTQPTHVIKDEISLAEWGMTVTGTKQSETIEGKNYLEFIPEKGSKFLHIEVKAKNKTGEDSVFLPLEITEKSIYPRLYIDDEEYVGIKLSGYASELIDKKVKKDEEVTGEITFEVPTKVLEKENDLLFKLISGDEYVQVVLKAEDYK